MPQCKCKPYMTFIGYISCNIIMYVLGLVYLFVYVFTALLLRAWSLKRFTESIPLIFRGKNIRTISKYKSIQEACFLTFFFCLVMEKCSFDWRFLICTLTTRGKEYSCISSLIVDKGQIYSLVSVKVFQSSLSRHHQLLS